MDGAVVEARRGIVIATGSRPVIPPIDGIEAVPYWTNHEAIEAEALPASLIVLGGGAVGLELAQVFLRFGVGVTIVEAAGGPLPVEEPEAGAIVQEVLEREGATVLLGAQATAARRDGDGVALTLDDGREVAAERLLVSVGRRVELRALGVDRLGLDASARSLAVDERMRAADGVWAIGDVTGHGAFTHIAVYQARIAAADIEGRDVKGGRYHALPRVTFTDPEVGAVGLTKAQARERGIDVRIGVTRVPDSTRGWIHGAGNEGVIKLVGDAQRDVLLGATATGPCGGEVLGHLALAVHAEIPVATLRTMIYAYPTFHRVIEGALVDLDGS